MSWSTLLFPVMWLWRPKLFFTLVFFIWQGLARLFT